MNIRPINTLKLFLLTIFKEISLEGNPLNYCYIKRSSHIGDVFHHQSVRCKKKIRSLTMSRWKYLSKDKKGGLTPSRLCFFSSFFLGGGDAICPRAISRKLLDVCECILQVDGMVKLNIRYTFVVMATTCDVIATSSVRKIPFWSSWKTVFFRIVFIFSVNVRKLLYQ